jgi:hypothetical protein
MPDTQHLRHLPNLSSLLRYPIHMSMPQPLSYNQTTETFYRGTQRLTPANVTLSNL